MAVSNSSNTATKGDKRLGSDYLARVRYRHAPPPPPAPVISLNLPPEFEQVTLFGRGAQLTHDTPMNLMTNSFLCMDLDLSSMPAAFQDDDSEINPRNEQYDHNPADSIMFFDLKNGGLKHRKDPVTWLRRTQYISSEVINNRTASTPSIESRGSFTAALNEKTKQSRESQLSVILKTFEDANDPERRKNLKHPTKDKLTPVEFIDVYPNFDTWDLGYTLCGFDGDPHDGISEISNEDETAKIDRLEKAIIQPMSYMHDNFLMYYLPSKEDAERLKTRALFEEEEEEKYRYTWIRDYSYDTGFGSRSNSRQLVFVFDEAEDPSGNRESVAKYNEISSRLQMKKKRRQQPLSSLSKGPEQYGKSSNMLISYKSQTENQKEKRQEGYRKIGIEESEIDHYVESATGGF